MNTIEGSIVNDRYLESIAYALHEEAKVEKDGYRFKKLVPAMTFYCFAMESKLNTFGKEVFTVNREFKQFSNATILGKFDWLLSRMGADASDVIEPHRETIAHMVAFRNSVAHSKNIEFQEERELIGLEQFGDRFVSAPKHEKDFMSQRSLETCERYRVALDFLERAWFILSRKYFDTFDPSRGSGISRASVVDRN